MITQVCTDFSFNIQSGSDFALVQLFCNSHKSMFYSQQNTENMSNVSFEFDESKKEDRFGQCLPLCSVYPLLSMRGLHCRFFYCDDMLQYAV